MSNAPFCPRSPDEDRPAVACHEPGPVSCRGRSLGANGEDTHAELGPLLGDSYEGVAVADPLHGSSNRPKDSCAGSDWEKRAGTKGYEGSPDRG